MHTVNSLPVQDDVGGVERREPSVIFSKSVGDDRLGPYGYDGLRDCVYEQRRRQSGQRERSVALHGAFVASSVLGTL